MNKINEIIQQREQGVVFSHFLGMLDFLQQTVADLSVPLIRIDGSTENR